jgi:hypothetical protein
MENFATVQQFFEFAFRCSSFVFLLDRLCVFVGFSAIYFAYDYFSDMFDVVLIIWA